MSYVPTPDTTPEYHQSTMTESASSNIALYSILTDCAHSIQPKSYLEIGCREGDSLLHVLRAAPSLSLIVICDIWGGNYGGSARGSHLHIPPLLSMCDYLGHVLFLNGYSQQLLPHLAATFDLVLVDGDHSLEGASIDLDNAWRLLRPDGILVMDDLTHPAHPYLGTLFHDFAAKMGADIIAHSPVGVGAGALRKTR